MNRNQTVRINEAVDIAQAMGLDTTTAREHMTRAVERYQDHEHIAAADLLLAYLGSEARFRNRYPAP